MQKLRAYREILNGDKAIIANRDNGAWIKISRHCRDIIQKACELSLTDEELLSSLADDEDREYFRNLLSKLNELGVIGNKEQQIKIDVVYLLITNRCNLKCIHCCADAADEDSEVCSRELGIDEWRDVIDKVSALKPAGIVLTGGEPLVKKEFLEILEYLRNKYEGTIALATNATLITDDNVKILTDLVDKFDVSIDGIDEETCSKVRGKGVFERVVRSIELLKLYGAKQITLSMTFGTANFHLKDRFMQLNQELGTTPIVRVFMPKGRGEKSAKKFNPYMNTDPDTSFTAQEIEEARKSLTIIRCGAGMGEFVINYDGWLYPCPNMIKERYKMIHIRDIEDLHYLHDKLYQQKSDGMRHLKGIQPENVEKCKNCKVNMFCWTCLEDLELHLSDEETFQQRCNNKRKILYSILWGKDPEV